MDENTTSATAVVDDRFDLDRTRPCTRCDGTQHLLAAAEGMGKYRCDTCEMVVGFDLADEEPEFLVSRGLPSRYTKNVFGERMTPGERRLYEQANV